MLTEVDLGSIGDLASLPTSIEHAGLHYLLVRDDDRYRLFSSVCPHQGGTVVVDGDRFLCPKHGWTFEPTTGRCHSVPKRNLHAYDVVQRDGRLWASLPVPVRSLGDAVQSNRRQNLAFKLHSHACLEMSADGESIVTDPWLDGPAFLGSWIPYPAPTVRPEDLRPKAFVITHEHSDHFHEPTLRRIDRSIPVVVPDFPNRRMPRRLAELGFQNVTAVPFGETSDIPGPGRCRVTFFEPLSSWNDAIALLDVDGFRILNLNDAGLNPRIAALIGPVDMLTAQFSIGASGYPLCWRHIAPERAADILRKSAVGKLKMLRESASLYGCKYLLPFASHFVLGPPQQRPFYRSLTRNSLADVVAEFRGTGVEVLDLYPGESWNSLTDEFERRADRTDDLTAVPTIERYLESTYSGNSWRRHHEETPVQREEVKRHLERLNDTVEIRLCEPLSFVLAVTDADGEKMEFELAYEVADGRLRLLPTTPQRPNLRIEIPGPVLASVVRHDLSWDEAFIGYWCRFERDPDVYHAGFWRMLQAPYYRKPNQSVISTSVELTRNSAVGDVLERFGDHGVRVLSRYGLYCSGCHRAPEETLFAAARKHGVEDRIELLLHELNATPAL